MSSSTAASRCATFLDQPGVLAEAVAGPDADGWLAAEMKVVVEATSGAARCGSATAANSSGPVVGKVANACVSVTVAVMSGLKACRPGPATVGGACASEAPPGPGGSPAACRRVRSRAPADCIREAPSAGCEGLVESSFVFGRRAAALAAAAASTSWKASVRPKYSTRCQNCSSFSGGTFGRGKGARWLSKRLVRRMFNNSRKHTGSKSRK